MWEIVDSAAIYHNEEDIGSALEELLPKFNLQRTDLFLTSKLCKDTHFPFFCAVSQGKIVIVFASPSQSRIPAVH